MKRSITTVVAILLLLAASASASLAQVKKVQMKIDGYLCGF